MVLPSNEASAASEQAGTDRVGRILLGRALEAAGYGVLVTGPDILAPGPVILFANAAMCRLTGYDAAELVGSTPRILQGPDTDRAMLDRLKAALLCGKGYGGEAVNYRKDGSPYVVDWTIDPVRDASGRIEVWVAVQRDVTRRHQYRVEREENEKRLEAMVAELQHRTRNLIGVVGAIARQTMAHTGPTELFQDELRDRLEALSRVQSLLSRAGEEPITIREVLEQELKALGAADAAQPVVLEGPTVQLRKTIVQTLALAIHELATNARKYGALSEIGKGRLTVRWTTHRLEGAERRLHLEWVEAGIVVGPTAGGEPVRGGGYGRQLIEKSLPYSLKARTTYALGADGLVCTIDLPLEKPRQRFSLR